MTLTLVVISLKLRLENIEYQYIDIKRNVVIHKQSNYNFCLFFKFFRILT